MTKHWHVLKPYLRPFKKRLLTAIAATALFNVLALCPPLIFRYLIDRVVATEQWHRLAAVLIIYALTPVLAHVIHFANTQNIIYVAHRFVAGLRLAMYRLLMHLSMRFHTENPTGGKITRIMDDTETVQQLVNGQTIQLLGDMLVYLFSVVVAVSIHPLLGMLLVLVTLLYAGAYRFFSRRISKATHSARRINDELVGRLQETLEGIRHVRIFTQEEQERETYLQRTAEGLSHHFTSGINTVSLSAVCNVIAGYGSTVIYGLAGYFVLQGSMTLGDLLALNTYVWMALHPALRLTSFAGQFAQIRVSLERIAEILNEQPDVDPNADAPSIECPHGNVEFRNVSFRYEADQPLFDGLNLNAKAGKTVALVGHTGCGKTTLTALLMRMWDVQEGAILIDGTDIRQINLRSLRRLFGVVLQSPVVFEGTIAENIAYGRPAASAQEIEDAARAAEVLEFAGRMPEGLQTALGSYGIKLSLGQKQRISIARALLRNPRILVMDEATSSLDSEAEAAIQRALKRVLQGRTSFIVAHRLSTIINADAIVVMQHGKIIEEGSHEQLMTNPDGYYRMLHEKMRESGKETLT